MNSGSLRPVDVFKYARDNSKMLAKLCGVTGVVAVANQLLGVPLGLCVAGLTGAYLATGGWRFAVVLVRTLPRDVKALYVLLKVKALIWNLDRKNVLVPQTFEKLVQKKPNNIAFMFEDQSWTYKDVNDYANSIANIFLNAGFRQGDVVALYMESRPEFVCVWLGLAKIGVCAALINFNLRGESFIHCVTAAYPKALVFGTELSGPVNEVLSGFPRDIQIYCQGGHVTGIPTSAIHIDSLLSTDPLLTMKPICTVTHTLKDKLFYIYTSGTTGLPKPAVISHARFYFMSCLMPVIFGVKSDDRVYTAIPLYHSLGGACGVSCSLVWGITVVISKKFSASRFWNDCIKYKCTVIQYIGEICRYLLAQPVKDVDKCHSVRMAVGNGIRSDIWAGFQSRFNIGKMCEFYGATEGNCNVINIPGEIGAVGFLTLIAPPLYPVWLFRVDEESGELIRDSEGMAVPCKPGESGHLVGRIRNKDPVGRFDGYVSKSATSKKIAQNCWKKGDTGFLSGDILLMDDRGFLYFKDRKGDTFRWRGENVATSEVEKVLTKAVGLGHDCVVYGVEVPGNEGRAGMATVEDSQLNVNLDQLAKHLTHSLPAYARPVFLRITSHIPRTGTFKLKKVELQQQGFDPSTGPADQFYYLDNREHVYKQISNGTYNSLVTGTIRI